jgi:hypothetical protein
VLVELYKNLWFLSCGGIVANGFSGFEFFEKFDVVGIENEGKDKRDESKTEYRIKIGKHKKG